MTQIRKRKKNTLWRSVKRNGKLIVTVIDAGNRGQIYKRL